MQRSDSGRVSCPVNGSTPRRASARAAARASASGDGGGDAAVRRIRDQRGPQGRQPLGHRRPQPELVVVVDVAGVAVVLVQPPLPLLGVFDVDDVPGQRIDALRGELGLQRGPLLLGVERLVAQVPGPFERGERLGGPEALQVGLPVGQAGHRPRRGVIGFRGLILPGGRAGLQDERRDDHEQEWRSETTMAHLIPPCRVSSRRDAPMIAQGRRGSQLPSSAGGRDGGPGPADEGRGPGPPGPGLGP